MDVYRMLALIALGYVLKMLVRRDTLFRWLNLFSTRVLLTLFVFGNVAGKDLEYLVSIRLVFLYVFLIIGLSLGLSYLYARLRVEDEDWAGALMILSTYPNTAAMGFPIASLFLKDITPAILYSTTNSLVVLPLATFIAAHYSSGKASIRRSVLRALKFPPTAANLLALALVLLGVRLPGWIIEPIKSIGWWSIPLLLIYFGSIMNLREFRWRHLAEVGLFRSVIPFLFVFLTLRGAGNIYYAVLVEASMPPAIMANVILAHYRLKAEEAIGVTVIQTLLVLAFFLAFAAFVT
ncbi:AEC family transporter [Thermococcus celer]|uniref:Transporter n=1 Tax=Thermococcus celer Vu 13 = JCM 8558 TaxID=1293037 RepID=A0A218P1M4_THECE|nr:AEC family transporter [Thermococcus celer]ASI98829.1 transporter [Thermococcus celer] [Thermococcus celer Vu 13 = JCM 8558]